MDEKCMNTFFKKNSPAVSKDRAFDMVDDNILLDKLTS